MDLSDSAQYLYHQSPEEKNNDYVPLKQDIDLLDDCEHDEFLKQMYELIHRLDNVDKMYIMLWLDEKNYDEIAEIVGVSRNNVAIRLHRIKEKLKRCRTNKRSGIWNLMN